MSDRKMSYARRKTGFVIAPRKESRENMTLEELIKEVPALAPYFEHMPEELHNRYTIRVYPPGTIIHQKDYKLEKFGIIAKGEHRVINEFQNGNVFMIEKNEPIAILKPAFENGVLTRADEAELRARGDAELARLYS